MPTRLLALQLTAFFLAVAAAPHHHLNAFEDLVSDSRSDSGSFVQTLGPDNPERQVGLQPARVIIDEPCLACFTSDFVCAPTVSILFVSGVDRLPLLPILPDPATPELVPGDTSSRAPPRFS